jgi:hypothetical protein
MKKYMMVALALTPVVLFAEGGHKGGKFKMDLTDEQKACLEEQGCPKPEFKKGEGEKPDKEVNKESRECMKKAFEKCGIERPERPDRPERKEPPAE